MEKRLIFLHAIQARIYEQQMICRRVAMDILILYENVVSGNSDFSSCISAIEQYFDDRDAAMRRISMVFLNDKVSALVTKCCLSLSLAHNSLLSTPPFTLSDPSYFGNPVPLSAPHSPAYWKRVGEKSIKLMFQTHNNKDKEVRHEKYRKSTSDSIDTSLQVI